MNFGFVKTRYGFCAAREEGGKITQVLLPPQKILRRTQSLSPLLLEFLQAVKQYFDEERKVDFSTFPVVFSGYSDFAIKTYRWLKENLRWGETITYGELANILGKPRGARAIGQILRKNPVPLIVPCHRVIAKTGIGGFTSSISLKAEMLRIEGISNLKGNALLFGPSQGR